MVLAIPAYRGTIYICTLEVPMDTLLLNAPGNGIYGHQHTQARDTRPDPYAGVAKRMVCATRLGIYVLVRTLGMRYDTLYRRTCNKERKV